VCFRRIPEDLIIRAHNDPDWIAANSVQTGEELDSEEDGDISVSDDSSSRSCSALSVLFCIIFVVCFVLCEMRLKRCCSLPEDADSSGSDSEAEKEEGDSDDDENEVEGVEDDDVDGAFFVLCIDMDFIWIRSQLGLQAKVAKATAELNQMAAGMVTEIGAAGETLGRLEEIVREEKEKAAGVARVARDSIDMTGIAMKAGEQKALERFGQEKIYLCWELLFSC
jgi:hypothetical protein